MNKKIKSKLVSSIEKNNSSHCPKIPIENSTEYKANISEQAISIKDTMRVCLGEKHSGVFIDDSTARSVGSMSVVFNPIDTITFDRMDQKSETTLTISNKSNDNLAYKIKTTNPRCQIVKPNNGIMQANTTLKVSITSQVTAMITPNKTDKFQIQHNFTKSNPTTSIETMQEQWKSNSSETKSERFTIKFKEEGGAKIGGNNLSNFASVIMENNPKGDDEEKMKLQDEVKRLKTQLEKGGKGKKEGGGSIVTLLIVFILALIGGFVAGNKSGIKLPF